jgi:hypothetical protein
MRITLLGALAVALAIAVTPAAANPPLVGSAQYVVRADPRLCPSPLCGGYWVALANRSRTRCGDESRRERCYVALAFDQDRHPLSRGIPDGALVRADIEPRWFDGFGNLGALIVGDVRSPLGRDEEGTYFRVRDLGIRCVRAPCFSLRAVLLHVGSRVTLSSLGLPASLTSGERARANASLRTTTGLFVRGTIVRTNDGGRSLRASRIYLKTAPPRA